MSWSHPAYEALARFVGTRTGLTLANRAGSVELGIGRAMERAKIADLDRYLQVIANDDALLDDLLCELTVGETYFFREPAQFRFIRRRVLPELRLRRGADHVLRAWSAGCASGEEPYSLAMMFDQEGLGERAHVLGTDVSRAALAKARRGVFGEWSLRGEDKAAALPFLTREKNTYRVREEIRKRVSIEYLNLALDAYPSFANGTWGLDLILCRNVLIYFDAATVQKVARQLSQALAEGGWLILASSDPPLWESNLFEAETTDDGVFYRRPPSANDWNAPVNLSDSSQQPASVMDAPESATDESEPHIHSSKAEPALSAPIPPSTQAASLDEARGAFARGEYAKVLEMTKHLSGDPDAVALHLRALANVQPLAAQRACEQATAEFPLTAELHYLLAVLLIEQGRIDEAVRSLRHVVYLDRSLAVAHLTLGSILRRGGDFAGARRAFRNARDLCAVRPPEDPVPFADGETAGRLAEIAAVELSDLDSAGAKA